MSGPRERTYFTDRDLGKQFGEILKAGGLTVERHADHFAPDTADEVCLAEIGKRGWVALTHDRRIRYKPNEREAVMRHGLALLVIVGNAPFSDLARAFVATILRIEQSSRVISRRSSPRCIGPRRTTAHQTARCPAKSNSGTRADRVRRRHRLGARLRHDDGAPGRSEGRPRQDRHDRQVPAV